MIPTKEAEGLRLRSYKDTVGVPTVGYGHNLNNDYSKKLFADVGADYNAVRSGKSALTQEQADKIFNYDHQLAMNGASKVVSQFGGNFDSLPDWVQNILTDMTFNMGQKGLSQFKQSVPLIIEGKYKEAAASLANSKWASQTGRRSKAIIQDLLAGRDTYKQYAMN